MAKLSNSSTYNQVVEVTRKYLGPAAERFINRQVSNHLKKNPKQLTKADLASLIDWIKVIVSLITEDTSIVEEYISELSKLSMTKTKEEKAKP